MKKSETSATVCEYECANGRITSGTTRSGAAKTAYGSRRPSRLEVRSDSPPTRIGRKRAKTPSPPTARPIALDEEVASPRRSGAYVVSTLMASASANVGGASEPSRRPKRSSPGGVRPRAVRLAERAGRRGERPAGTLNGPAHDGEGENGEGEDGEEDVALHALKTDESAVVFPGGQPVSAGAANPTSGEKRGPREPGGDRLWPAAAAASRRCSSRASPPPAR